jgi:RimJ/RimL family protein N-acetyltransferase
MLLGKMVRLRAIERSDLARCVRWLNDPDVVRYLAAYFPLSMAQEERWFERLVSDENRQVYAIEAEEGAHIGNIGLESLNWKDRSAALGIFIGEREYWARGYGTDAVQTLLRFAFEELNLHRVWLTVHDDNPRAIRCYEKCGFRHEGRDREAWFGNGEYHDELRMGILQFEFAQEGDQRG